MVLFVLHKIHRQEYDMYFMKDNLEYSEIIVNFAHKN